MAHLAVLQYILISGQAIVLLEEQPRPYAHSSLQHPILADCSTNNAAGRQTRVGLYCWRLIPCPSQSESSPAHSATSSARVWSNNPTYELQGNLAASHQIPAYNVPYMSDEQGKDGHQCQGKHIAFAEALTGGCNEA